MQVGIDDNDSIESIEDLTPLMADGVPGNDFGPGWDIPGARTTFDDHQPRASAQPFASGAGAAMMVSTPSQAVRQSSAVHGRRTVDDLCMQHAVRATGSQDVKVAMRAATRKAPAVPSPSRAQPGTHETAPQMHTPQIPFTNKLASLDEPSSSVGVGESGGGDCEDSEEIHGLGDATNIVEI